MFVKFSVKFPLYVGVQQSLCTFKKSSGRRTRLPNPGNAEVELDMNEFDNEFVRPPKDANEPAYDEDNDGQPRVQCGQC